VLAPHAAPPGPLLRALERRGLDAELHHDPPAALVALRRAGAVAVVLVDPGMIPRAEELLAAVRAYFPRVACWSYFGPTNGAGPKIQQACPGIADGPRAQGPGVSDLPESSNGASGAAGAGEPPEPGSNGSRADPAAHPVQPAQAEQPQRARRARPGAWTRPASIDELAVPARRPETIQTAVVTEQELAMLLGPAGP